MKSEIKDHKLVYKKKMDIGEMIIEIGPFEQKDIGRGLTVDEYLAKLRDYLDTGKPQ